MRIAGGQRRDVSRTERTNQFSAIFSMPFARRSRSSSGLTGRPLKGGSMSILSRATLLLSPVVAVACAGDANRNVLAPSAQTRDLAPLSSQASAGPAASGHGNVTQAPGVLRTFSFEARVMPDGSVEGNFNNHNRLAGFVNLGDVDCLRLIGSNGAVLSGPVRKHTNPAFETWSAVFRVEDNGEGGDPPDRVSVISLQPPGSPNTCHTFTPGEQDMRVVEGGNIQVRP
jgi:hypothetical protein